MNAIATARLQERANRPTRYEVTLTHATNPAATRLVGYTTRHSFQGLASLMHLHASDILQYTAMDENAIAMRTKGAAALAWLHLGDWVIAFTGRTEREAITAGELHPIWRKVDGPRYDYDRQCWIVAGKVDACGHPEHMKPNCCYAGAHAGEVIA